MCSGTNCENGCLLYFPKLETETLYKGSLKITWFESSFSQSYYNSTQTNGSNACTIIAILVASKCHKDNLQIMGETLTKLVCILGQSMLEGNQLHTTLKAKKILKNLNLTVPEAIKYTGYKSTFTEWKSSIYFEPLSTSLYKNIFAKWLIWIHSSHSKHHPNLYIILICDFRSVLFILQGITKTITLVDSHQHSSTKGALIAFTKISKIKHLCDWFSDMISKCYNSEPQIYELSFLYFKTLKRYV